jgi:uroporphyrinogen-III synthase
MPAQSFAPTFLLTRPAAQSARFASQLHQVFAQTDIVISPLFHTQYFAPPLPKGPFDAVIFTSQAGVEAAQRLNAPGLPNKAYCVGPATQSAAQLAGFDARGTAGDLSDLIGLIQTVAANERLLYLRGADVTADLDAILDHTLSLVVYQQVEQPLTAEARSLLAGENPVILPVFSKRSARNLCHNLTNLPRGCSIWGAALSAAIAHDLTPLGCEKLVTASNPSNDALIFAISQLIGQSSA